MSNHPIIGITADYQEKVNCYSKYPWFALRKHYTSCLERLGCMPIILPPSKNFENIDFLDGLLISGGDFDIDPSFYDQKIKSNNVKTIPKRTEFEMDLINLFIQSQKPTWSMQKVLGLVVEYPVNWCIASSLGHRFVRECSRVKHVHIHMAQVSLTSNSVTPSPWSEGVGQAKV